LRVVGDCSIPTILGPHFLEDHAGRLACYKNVPGDLR
jgi:hypothetical protein